MKKWAIVVGVCVALILLLGRGAQELITRRKQAAREVFLHAMELAKCGSWDEAFELTHPNYRRFANLANFRGDVGDLTNEIVRYKPGFEVCGGWRTVEIRYEFKDQPQWGTFIELRSTKGTWLISDRGTWTSSDF